MNHWLLHWGMSIGIGDTVADDATMTTINEIIEKAKEEVKKIINTYQAGELEQMPGRTLQESFENRVNAVLNKARDDAGKKAQNSLDLTVGVAGGGDVWCGGCGGGRGRACSSYALLVPGLVFGTRCWCWGWRLRVRLH